MKHGQKNIRKPKGICWREGEMMPEGGAVAQQHAETMIYKKERRREICSALIIDKV